MSACNPSGGGSRPRRLKLPVGTAQFSSLLLSWYATAKRALPWRRTSDPYQIWVSEVMLQQTRVKTVLPYFQRFVRTFPSVEELASADEQAVLKLWSGLGYYRRARDLLKAARIVAERYAGEFPASLREALSLPGVGRYTAGAVLSIAYGKPLPVADGNVMRVLVRYIGIDEEISPNLNTRTWNLLENLVRDPAVAENIGDFNQALMELGATVCTPRNPDCPNCPLVGGCRASQLGIQTLLPRPAKKRELVEMTFTVFLVHQGKEFLLHRNLGRRLLGGLWQFPMVEGKPDEESEKSPRSFQGLRFLVIRHYPCLRHQITFRKLWLHPVSCTLADALPEGPDWIWSRLDQPRVPVPSYVTKIARKVPMEKIRTAEDLILSTSTSAHRL